MERRQKIQGALLTVIFWLLSVGANARGFIFHTKGEVSVMVPYAEQDCVSTCDSDDEPSVNQKTCKHEYVDLGLSVKWATCNVGASSPEEYGDYYAWGETETKSTYNWNTYKYCKGSFDTSTKYCASSSYGTIDNKNVLELSDDVARVKWGGDWRMPTDAELTELREKCIWTWTTRNGLKGYKVTSKTNGCFIFLPAAGYCHDSLHDNVVPSGYYWSASLGGSYPGSAWFVSFNSCNVYVGNGNRCSGQSVRPVCP